MKPIHQYRCVNGAAHSYMCCPTCANQFKVPGEEGDFQQTHAAEIARSRHDFHIAEAQIAGFTWE